MTSAEHNELMPSQEKLEWVTPKISLMEAGDTEGKFNFGTEGQNITPNAKFGVGS